MDTREVACRLIRTGDTVVLAGVHYRVYATRPERPGFTLFTVNHGETWLKADDDTLPVAYVGTLGGDSDRP